MASPSVVADRLGYQFQRPELLVEALTPPSAGLPANHQRLEYLGDALLHAAMGLLIFRLKPEWKEGPMSKLRGMLVNVDSLRAWAEDLAVELVKGPRSPRKPTAMGAQKPISDAMEAVLAAVHEDAVAQGRDGFLAVFELVAARFGDGVRKAQLGIWETQDPKTTLQERAAALGLPAPVYELVRQSGPDHQPVFHVRVTVGPQVAEASGQAVKRAQAEAAAALLPRLA